MGVESSIAYGKFNATKIKQILMNHQLDFRMYLIIQLKRTKTICYSNAVLQILYHTKRFRELIISSEEKYEFMNELSDIFKTILKNTKPNFAISTKKFMSLIDLKKQKKQAEAHQDAHEFFIYLVNQINQLLQNNLKKQGKNSNPQLNLTSLEKQMFIIQSNKITCFKCSHVNQFVSKQIDLSLSINQPNVSINYCIKQYCQKQILKDDNKFKCQKCDSMQQGQKIVLFKTLPKYLVIHLKRFKYDEKTKGILKSNAQVAFPFQLKLKQKNEQKLNNIFYKLYGIIVHIGQANKHGHYISIVKIKNKWIQFNDEDIQFRDEQMFEKLFGSKHSNLCAYMLFYER